MILRLPITHRTALHASAGLLALAHACVAQAAEETATNVIEEAEAIVVTGSRLRTDGMEMPVPVTVVDAAEIEALSPGSLVTGLSQLPQFYGNQTPGSGSTRGTLNLRGLGLNRTLTLLNGRRVPGTTASGGSDINLFPEALVRTVETTTGGASAAYGTDAVAGVVNFILDTRFTGLEISAQSGITSRRDGGNQEISAAFGTPFASGRGHLLVSAEYARQSGIDNYRGRDWYQGWGTFGSGTTADPYRFAPGMTSRNATFDGTIRAPGTVIDGLAFNRDGSVSPFINGSQVQGAFGTPAARQAGGGSGDDLGAEVRTLIPDANRHSFFGYAEFDATDNLKLFTQYMHGNSRSKSRDGSGGTRASFIGSPATLTIFADNAFLSESLRQTMADNDIDSFILRRVGSLEDIGILYSDEKTVQHIATGGFEWDLETDGLFNGWRVDGFYQYGRSRRTARQFGLRLDRVYAAIDAVRDPNSGDVVCRVTLYSDAFPGCQPLNLFGRGNASAAAIDYVTGFEAGQQITTPIYWSDTGYESGDTLSYTSSEEKVNVTTFTQQLAELSFAGNLLDGWAGPIAAAFGGSWRKESIRQVTQDVTNPAGDYDNFYPVLCDGEVPGLRGVAVGDCTNTVGVQYSKLSNIKGSTRVWEAFGEVMAPLLDTGGFSASVNLAGRWADYSGSGAVWAYKAGLDVGLGDWARLRGTYSRDVRAGNLAERFDKSGGTAVIDDPRTEEVEAITVIRYAGGNPAIRPEKADTYTAGIVLHPPVVDGLRLSLDWYDIRIKDAIGQVGTQAVVDRCFLEDAAEFCELVTTNPTTGDITLVGDVFVNVAQARVQGIDLEVDYEVPLTLLGGDESLRLRGFGGWLLTRSETNSSGITTDYAGQIGATQNSQTYLPYADFKATGSITYRNGDTSGTIQGRYIGSGIQDAQLEEGATILDNSVASVLYVDLRLSQRIAADGRDANVWLTVTNLFDRDPPLTPSWRPFNGFATQHNASVHDLLGRRFTVGATMRF